MTETRATFGRQGYGARVPPRLRSGGRGGGSGARIRVLVAGAPLWALLLLVAGTSCRSASGPVQEAERAYENPVVTPVAADPSVIRGADRRYYLYATNENWGDGAGLRVIPIFASTNLTDWAFVGTVFDELPVWKQEGSLWAPDVSFHDSTYYLYYAYSKWGDPNPCMGLATAPHPAGPWTDLDRPVFCSKEIGVGNSIDAFAWDEDGERWLIWGSFHGIYAITLSDDGTRPVGEKVRLADERFEAPYVYKRGPYYYLFLSAGTCCGGAESTYRVYAGRSRNLTGPYIDAEGRDLRKGGGSLVVQGDAHWAGPGHNAVVADDAGTAWLVYHAMPRDDARLTNGTNRREALIDPLVWSEDGWPYVEGRVPSAAPRPAPVVDGSGETVRRNPILPISAADPSIAFFDGRYYLYATGAGATETGFAVWSSPDFVSWTSEGMILAFADLPWVDRNAWAPDIAERNGTYYFYFSADSRIGVATADSPTGPFTDALGEPLIPYSDDLSNIDPMAFIDDDGQAYLYWGAVPAAWLEGKVDTIYTTLWVRKLNDDMISFDGPAVPTVGTRPEGPHIEGSYVFKRDSTYYLMWSEGNWNAADEENAYRVKYATATSPMGPFAVAENNPILSSDWEAGIIGTGHNSVLKIPGEDAYYIVYHAHDGQKNADGGGPHRHVYIDRLEFNADGSIRPVRPTHRGVGALPASVALAAQERGPYHARSALTLEAVTGREHGEIEKVEFFAGDAKLGEARQAPYTFIWQDASAGYHRLTARVVKSSGETVTSAPLHVDIR